jgi:23S rRNA (adenine2503-C2)-methyltransferase
MAANNSHLPKNLLGQSAEELRALMQSLGEPAYRGTQIYRALYAERRFDVANMSNLPLALRKRLARDSVIALPQIVRRYRSSDGTVRYVLALPAAEGGGEGKATKPATVEAVFMPEEHRQTICISTQAGCAVDCHFCLTATLGLIRNLSAGEIVGQVLIALEENHANLKPQTNVVLMGQGEPLLNYEPVMAALRILLDPNGMAITPKHTTLSTSGIIPGIERLGGEKVRPKLAISLNASSNEQRDKIMPINRKYPIEDLLAACAQCKSRTNSDSGHHPAGGVFAPIAEKKIAAARGAETGRENILGCYTRTGQNRAICGNQIQMGARSGRCMSRRAHGEPRQPVGIVVAILQRIHRTGEPFPGARELCGEFLYHFVADFVTASADSWTQRSDHVLRARAKFHSHAAERFFGDALHRAAPARMNHDHSASLRIGQQDGNAIRGLDR